MPAPQSVALESLLLSPLMVGYLIFLGIPHYEGSTWLVLALTGPVTVIPLVCFVVAARRLDFAIFGLLSYLTPAVQFLLAVFLFGELFGTARLIAFSLIWLALVVFGWDLARRHLHGGPQVEDEMLLSDS